MKKTILFITSLSAIVCGYAQNNQPKADSTTLEEVVVSTSNYTTLKKNTVQKVDVITAKTIANANAQNVGDLLAQTGKVFVQKSQQGGSSPVVRGFEASRILLVIDGVRMNNAIYRSGHLQNAITVDQNSLEAVEVTQGAASTVYGSDALGGIVHFVTKGVKLSTTNKLRSTGSYFNRFSTANNEQTYHFDMSLAGKKFGWFQSYNFSNFGDLRMGSKDKAGFENFGTKPFYIETSSGVDLIKTNKNPRIQKYSGYQQWDITQKLLYQPNEKTTHQLNFQWSSSNDVPRYDRSQDERNFGGNIGTTLRWAEWYYGPQKRLLTAYKLNTTLDGFFQKLQANVNYQEIEESRIQREYLAYDRLDSRIEKVKVMGATINLVNKTPEHETNLGIDMQYNTVKSEAIRTNTITGNVRKLDTRYPDGKNNTLNAGLYLQHTYVSKNKKWVVNDGIRIQYAGLKSNIIDNSFLTLPVTNYNQNNFALTGNIGANYFVTDEVTLSASLSSGFRAPNLDDLVKIFESSTALQQVVVPNANVKPEKTYTIDFAIKHKIDNKLFFDITPFITFFRNALIKAPFQLNGQDSIIYNGVKSAVLANVNANNATVRGIDFNIKMVLAKDLTLQSTLSLIRGDFNTDESKKSNVFVQQPNGSFVVLNKNVDQKPLDHIPPTIGKTALNYAGKKFGLEFNAIYNGAKKLDRYNADGEDNQQYATRLGTLAWTTLNFSAYYNLNSHFKLQAALENIADVNYRPFASGFSAAGRNFLISLRASW